jgi:glycosyltransferase involved in cell wall biosynthesis
MPAHNAERFIGRAIKSILDQTVTDLELIVHLDAPTDGTAEVARRFAASDSRVVIIDNQENVGVCVGLNRAIAASRGMFIGRMDADDISTPDRFERQIDIMRANPDVVIVGSDALHINADDEILGLSIAGPRTAAEFQELREAGELTVVLDGTALMRRSALEAVGGYDPAMPIAQEVDLHCRMASQGVVMAIGEPLLLYRLHPDSRVATRFFEGRAMHRYVKARNRALLENRPPMSYAEYVASERTLPLRRRARIRLSDLGQFHYRTAGVRLAGGRRASAVAHLGGAFLASPGFVIERAWHRRFSPQARRMIDEASAAGGGL